MRNVLNVFFYIYIDLIKFLALFCHSILGGGRVVRWCWVNFQYRGVLQFGLQ